MNVLKVKKGETLARKQDKVMEWYLIQEGSVIRQFAFAEIIMHRNAIVGILENEWFACDYVGIVSGNKEPDKFAKAGFTAEKSEKVDAPIIKELPICVECKLKSYDKETCRLVGEIVNVSVDERVLDKNGNVDVVKAAPITFDPFNNAYISLGEKVGDAFKAGAALK